MTALEQDIELVLVSGPGFTEDEAYAFLAGIGRNTSTAKMPLVAAANEGHTGAMIALVPSDADVKRLAVKGGEDPDQLHLTLAFLGEAADITSEAREQITAAARRYAKSPVSANAFAVNVFNPKGDEPCVVLGVGNGDSSLEELRSNVISALNGMSGLKLPAQHTPWVPHVTMAYTSDFGLVEQLTDRTGPITFDKIRVAFGDDVTDIPLGESTLDDQAADEIMTAATIAKTIQQVLAGDRNLRNYWTHGAGAAKIRWGTDGSFDRCVRHLGKYVGRPQGLCAEYHKEATGEWPAEKGVESAMTTPLVAHGSHKQQDHNPHRGKSAPSVPGGGSGGSRTTRSGSDKSDVRSYVDRLKKTANSGGEGARDRLVKRMTGLDRDELGDISDELGIPEDEISGSRAQIVQQLVDRILKASVLVAHGTHNQQDHTDDDDDEDDGTRRAYFGLHPLIAAARKKKSNQYADEPWEGVLAVEGTESGDSRLFNLGSLDWASPPLPLMYQPANVGGHNASIVAGEITHIARKGNEVRGWGHVYGNMLVGEHGEGIRNMMKAGGVSVDVDKVKDADVEEVFADGDDGGFMSKPELTIFNRGRVRGATLVAFPAFVEAKLSFNNELTTAAVDPGESCGCGNGVLVASGHTITIPDLPPAHWFAKPDDVKMYGALTITDEGRVFGWVAPSDVTHRSVRKTVPMGSRVDYSRWMNKETIVAGGHRIKTGVLTMGCGHAATENYGTLANRKEHYDNTCSIFANAVVGEEPGKGVWFAGALRHGVTADQVTAALGSSLSGDWQPHPDRPGVQEFIAALLVPVPGFPMARSRPSVEYQDGLITASVVPIRFGPAEPRSQEELAVEWIGQAKSIIMESLGLDPASQKRAAMALIEGM